jgi:hypothetical protein
MQNLNALFGVAYREKQRFSVPQLGYLGYQVTKWLLLQLGPGEKFVFEICVR